MADCMWLRVYRRLRRLDVVLRCLAAAPGALLLMALALSALPACSGDPFVEPRLVAGQSWKFDDSTGANLPPGLLPLRGQFAMERLSPPAEEPSPAGVTPPAGSESPGQGALCWRSLLDAQVATAGPVEVPLGQTQGLLATGQRYGDVTVSVLLRFAAEAPEPDLRSAAPAAGLAVRVRDRDNYIVLRANLREGELMLVRVKAGQNYLLAQALAPIAAHRWHQLRLDVGQGHLRCFLDGRLLIDAPDYDPLTGRVGLWARGGARTCFDELAVTGQATW